MKIVILTRTGNGSPKILAESLQIQLKKAGVEAEILFEIEVLNRLVGYKDSKLSYHFWLKKIISNYFHDKKIIHQLKDFDAIIISESSPNGFWRNLYNVERLKKMIKRPVLYYEVYYLGNAPTQVAKLQNNNDPLLERYDAHLFISPVTEIREKDPSNAYSIGLLANTWNLLPLPKKELIALVDFAQPGYEAYREMQVEILRKAGIRFISLEKRYTIEAIREIYRQAAIFFMPSYEAFGLPILECLCTGAQIFTADSGWPMSWRLDEEPQVHGKGTLPGCFTVYDGENDLLEKLLLFKANFNPTETPLKVFNEFIKNYPAFYEGDDQALKNCLDQIVKSTH
jgi:glycosyltransferase involved in cell wall biosynthesis